MTSTEFVWVYAPTSSQVPMTCGCPAGVGYFLALCFWY